MPGQRPDDEPATPPAEEAEDDQAEEIVTNKNN
jgi:hypothetical protein